MNRLFWTACAASLAAPLTVMAQSDENSVEFENVQIHSKLPLYTFKDEEFWPRSIDVPDAMAACATRIRHGDWQFKPSSLNELGEEYWLRLAHYGTFHCATNIQFASSLDELEDGELSRGFFARIGTSIFDGEEWELWVLQEGTVPGSDYTLLARNPQSSGIIQQFRVLQRVCPDIHVLETELDVWGTRYCAIDTREELISLATAMLQRPPLGVLELVSSDEGSDVESDPSD